MPDKTDMLKEISKINEIEGFDPEPFAVDFVDLNTGEKRKRLPVMIQMAWFRMKYPEGRISVQVSSGKDCFVATARVYPSYKDPESCYLSEATASRGYLNDKPSVSPREWAQTAAIGIALRNAGFGLQFAAAGDDFEESAPNELSGGLPSTSDESEYETEPTEPAKELTPEEMLKRAMLMSCPITKYKDKTLGDLVSIDPKALNWIAIKYTGDEKLKEAAKLICESALAAIA